MNIIFSDKWDAQVERVMAVNAGKVLVRTVWEVEHIRDGKVIDRTIDFNLVTDEGINAILEKMFHSGAQITAWYIAPFETNTTPVIGMTYAVPTFTETTAYNEANRVASTFAAAAAKSITNTANTATFTFNAAKTIYGAALFGGGSAPSTKGDVAGGGTLFAVALFGAPKSVVATDILRITVTIPGATQ